MTDPAPAQAAPASSSGVRPLNVGAVEVDRAAVGLNESHDFRSSVDLPAAVAPSTSRISPRWSARLMRGSTGTRHNGMELRVSASANLRASGEQVRTVDRREFSPRQRTRSRRRNRAR